MIINELKVIDLFCELDDFVAVFDKKLSEHILETPSPQSVNRPEINIQSTMQILQN
ncbi:MAG TPA: hypothetical protein VN040_16000 [Pseudosphingobacterium sp.]|nr:hypothetical protein [Pseudosphingobacterium sp.]